MLLIEKVLIDYGFARSRVGDLALGLEAMHKALALMDKENYNRFTELSLNEWLNKFAKIEELRELE